MKILNRFKNLIALAAIIIIAFAMTKLGAPLGVAVLFVGLWQLLQLAMQPRRKYCFVTALTEAQIKEFEDCLEELKELGKFVPGFKELETAEGGNYAIKKLPSLLKAEGLRVDQLQKDLNKIRKHMAEARHSTGVKWIGNVPFVTDDCAKSLSSVLCLQSFLIGEQKMNALNKDPRTHKRLVELSCENLGIEQRAGGALTPTDIPLPTIYMPQVIELVFAYGQARQFGTVFPLGAGTVKLPRLQAGEDSFAFLGAGTAGMSQQIGEKEVTAQLVTFTANKMGGLIRIPTELEEDTFIALGQFLARYIARQFAKVEDSTMFLADGTGTYANIVGVGNYCVQNAAYLHQLGAGKTVSTDATINDFRALRALVNPAVLFNMAANGQTQAAYYLHPTLEALLVTFNTIGQPLIYIPPTNGRPATLDGFPIRWIGVSQPYSLNATPSTFLAFFGDLSFWYLGERGAPRVEVSREVYFATDELAMRALERIDVEAMAVDAMATLQLPAA